MALGLTLIWSSVRLVNFAHGVFFVWGGYVAWFLLVGVKILNYAEAMVLAFITIFIMGYIMERIAVRQLRDKPMYDTTSMLLTLGVAIFLESAALQIFGPRSKLIPTPFEGILEFSEFSINYHNILIITLTLSTLVAAWLFLKNTRTGMAMRSIAIDRDASSLVGINVSKIYALTVGVGAATAALAGILLSSIYFLNPSAGLTPLLMAFIVVVFGGIGSIKGSIYAAYIIGIIDSFITLVLGLWWSLPILFVIMIITLIIRPRGLMGLMEEEI
jgi:branched-chain amino acid transport system permease protein